MKKFGKIGKRVLALFIVALLNINTYAAVSGNDGSAFVTKAEFDALVNTFSEQMDNYENSLISKIDGAIANYLASMTKAMHVPIETGISVETGSNSGQVRFIKKAYNHNNMSNALYGSDNAYVAAVGTYRKLSAFEQDTYDTLVFNAKKTNGNANNQLYLINSDGVVQSYYRNVKVEAERNYVFYSTTDANNGLTWTKVDLQYNIPGALYSNTSCYLNTGTTQGIAFKRSSSNSSAPDSAHPSLATGRIYQENTCDASTGNTSNFTLLGTWQYIWKTANTHNQARTDVSKSCIVNFTGTKQTNVDHWPLGSNYKLKSSTNEWASVAMMKKAADTTSAYTITINLRYVAGQAAYNAIWPSVTTSGYGLTFNTTDKDVTAVYYKNLDEKWGKKIKLGGGFPLVYLTEQVDKGTITVPIKLSTQATVCVTNTQTTTMPAEGASTIIPFSYRPAGGDWVEVGSKPVLLGASSFELKFDLQTDDISYLTASWETADNTLTITQEGAAYLDTQDTV